MILLQDTGGVFGAGASHGWAGGSLGLARTARLEWADMTIVVIDVALNGGDMTRPAKSVVDVLGEDISEIGIDADGRRTGLSLGQPLSPPTMQATSLTRSDPNGVWLVSGGARGITSACVIELAHRVGGRYALLGRSARATWPEDLPPTDDADTLRKALIDRAAAKSKSSTPARIEHRVNELLAAGEIERTLSAIRATGAEARYEIVDLGDARQVEDGVARIRNGLGPITGLIHGAGALADRLIVDMLRDQFDRVFSAKVLGLKALLDALDLQALRHVALFSSASAYFGNVGQANYAMANEIVNSVARSLHEQLPDAMVKSFGWGPWDGGMVDRKLARHFKAKGIGLIPKAIGSRLFVDQLLHGHPDHVELVIGER